MQKFHNTCCYFDQNPKHKGSISSSKFHKQLPNILFTCLYLCEVSWVVAVDKSQSATKVYYFLYNGPLNSMLGGDISKHMGGEGHEQYMRI